MRVCSPEKLCWSVSDFLPASVPVCARAFPCEQENLLKELLDITQVFSREAYTTPEEDDFQYSWVLLVAHASRTACACGPHDSGGCLAHRRPRVVFVHEIRARKRICDLLG